MDRLIEMGRRFVEETAYNGRVVVDPERVAETVVNVVRSPDGIVLVSGSDASISGMIAVIVYPHPFSGERIATELVWWVDPEARGDGIRLLRAAEAWAREVGAVRMQMVAPDERVGALYRRMGYEPVETSYQRSL